MSANHPMAEAPRPSRPFMPGYGLLSGGEDSGLLEWRWLTERMERSRNYWLVTVDERNRPHTVPVWGLWSNGVFYFGTGSDSRKGRNLAANPNVVVHLESGDEVIILEGSARPEVDELLIAGLDEAYRQKYEVGLKGNPIYAVVPDKAIGWLEADFPRTATRWRLAGK